MKNEHYRRKYELSKQKTDTSQGLSPRLTEGIVPCGTDQILYTKDAGKKEAALSLDENTQLASKRKNPLGLSVFTPGEGVDNLRAHALEDGLIPDDNPSVGALKKTTQEKPPEYFMEGAGEKIMERASEAVYEKLKERFGLETNSEAERFYEKIMTDANTQVMGLVDGFCPEERNNLGLKNQVERVSSPGKVIRLLEDPKTDPRVVHELTRQVSMGLLAAELDLQTKEIKKTLDKVEDWLDIDLFTDTKDIPEKDKPKNVRYALHDNVTNEVIHVDGVIDEKPIDLSTVHLKAHRQELKYVKGIGWVVHDTRMKKTGPSKAIYKAIDREATDGTLQATKDVPDMIGMKLIAEDDAAAEALIVRVSDILKNRFGLSDEAFRRKDVTRGAAEQSGRFLVKGRLMVTLPGCPVELELMVHTQQEELHNTYEVGIIDQDTGKPTGAAHKIMAVGRAEKVLQRFFPPEIYPDIDWGAKKKQNYEDITAKLKRENRADLTKIDAQTVDETILEYMKQHTNAIPIVDFGNFPKKWK